MRPGDRVGGFVIVEPIGRGGMAELHLAQPAGAWGRWRRPRVVKTMLPNLEVDEDFVALFRKEARVASTLRHRGITRVLGFSTRGRNPHLVLEHVDGADLQTVLGHAVRRYDGFDRAVGVGIVREVARALHYAHERRGPAGKPLEIVHCDVTPSNVLISRDGKVKLTDFGIAKTLAVTRTTRASWLKGKAGYMSPEQCLGAHVDRRSDVFALGILLYEVTTGYRAFYAPNPYESTNRVLATKYEPPSQLVEGYPKLLETIVARALSRDREDRFATAEQFECALASASRGLGLATSRAERAHYLRAVMRWPEPRLRRRNVGVMLSAAGVAAAGLALAVGVPVDNPVRMPTADETTAVPPPADPIIPASRPSVSPPPTPLANPVDVAPAVARSTRRRAPRPDSPPVPPSDPPAGLESLDAPRTRKPSPAVNPDSLLPPTRQRAFERSADPLNAAFPTGYPARPAGSASPPPSDPDSMKKAPNPGDDGGPR